MLEAELAEPPRPSAHRRPAWGCSGRASLCPGWKGRGAACESLQLALRSPQVGGTYLLKAMPFYKNRPDTGHNENL